MNRLNCLIIDDEELARQLLETYVLKIPDLRLVDMCKNPLEALPFLKRESIDLLFLDIQMPEITGIDFLKALREKPFVIFTTAYPQYALESYELDVLDYLVKPIRFERFFQAVQKAITRSTPTITSTGNKKEREKDYLLVRADHKVYRLPLEDIVYIKGMQEYVAFHTTSHRIISLNALKHLEETLPSDQFIRVHKSYIVALAAIRSLEGNQLNIGGEKIPIGSHYKEELLKRVFS